MTDAVTLHLPTRLRNRFVGKIAAIGFIGVLIGVLFNRSELAEYHRGQELTLAQYTANFDVFRAGLMEHKWPLAVDVAFCLVMVAIFLGVYELLAAGIAVVLNKLFPAPR